MSRPMQRSVASLMVVSFVMILFSGSWQHCWPDRYAALFKKLAIAENLTKIRGPHHVCAAIKDCYDAMPALQVERPADAKFPTRIAYGDQHSIADNHRLSIHDLSPPYRAVAHKNIPLFELNSTLRI